MQVLRTSSNELPPLAVAVLHYLLGTNWIHWVVIGLIQILWLKIRKTHVLPSQFKHCQLKYMKEKLYLVIFGCIPLEWSKSGLMKQDRPDHGESKESQGLVGNLDEPG